MSYYFKKQCVRGPRLSRFQETMCVRSKVVKILSSFLKEWSFCSLEAEGFSGGLISDWNANLVVGSTYVFNANIEIEVRSKEIGKLYRIINLYGPNGERNPFWQSSGDSDILNGNNCSYVYHEDMYKIQRLVQFIQPRGGHIACNRNPWVTFK